MDMFVYCTVECNIGLTDLDRNIAIICSFVKALRGMHLTDLSYKFILY